ncbi:MAG: hypothetical protein ACI4JD_01820 [Ruminococcus sp.]
MKKLSIILAAVFAMGGMILNTGCIAGKAVANYAIESKESDAKNELSSVVAASQTIVSSAYASKDGMYTNNNIGVSIEVVAESTEFNGDFTPEALDCVIELAEVEGTLYKVSVSNAVITFVQYEAENGIKVQYSYGSNEVGSYEVVDSFD